MPEVRGSSVPASWEYLMPQRRERMALYIRESDPGLADSVTIESQAKVVREYGEQQVYIYDSELDFREAISAYEVPYMDRKRLQDMLFAAKKKLFDVLVVSEIRAISRRQVEVLVIYDLLQKYGVRLETVKEKFGEDAMSKAILSLRAMWVEVEVEQSKMRMERGKKDRVMIGQAPKNVTPCYTHILVDTEREVKGRYILNLDVVYTDEEGKEWTRVDVARFFCNLLAQGGSLHKTAKTLNGMGIPTAKGGLWQPSTLRGIISNPILYGEVYTNRYVQIRKQTSKNGKRVSIERLRPREEWIRLPDCPAVITKETYDLIQFQIKANKVESIRNNKQRDPGLVRSGYIFCGICGVQMSVRPDKDSVHSNRYECKKQSGTQNIKDNHRVQISMLLIDTAVKEKIAEALRNSELIRARIEEIQKEIKPSIDPAPIYARLAEIEQSIQNFFELAKYATTQDMVASLARQMNDLEKQKRDAEKLLYLLEDDHEEQQAVEAELVKFETWANKVRPFLTDPAYLKTASYDELRLAVRILGIRVTVFPTAGEWEYRYQIEITLSQIVGMLFSEHMQSSVRPSR